MEVLPELLHCQPDLFSTSLQMEKQRHIEVTGELKGVMSSWGAGSESTAKGGRWPAACFPSGSAPHQQEACRTSEPQFLYLRINSQLGVLQLGLALSLRSQMKGRGEGPLRLRKQEGLWGVCRRAPTPGYARALEGRRGSLAV